MHVPAALAARRWWAIVAGLAAAAAVRRAWELGGASLWLDEGTTALRAQGPWWQIVAGAPQDVHPPTYLLLMWGWVRVAGSSEAALRFPSVLAGVLAVVAVALLARRLAGGRASLVAAALLAANAFAIAYSREARSYSLLLLATGLTLWTYWRWAEEGHRWSAPAFAVAALALLHLHLSGAFVMAGIGLHRLLRHAQGLPAGAWRRTLSTFGAILLGVVPWALVMVGMARREVGEGFLGLPEPGFTELAAAARGLAGSTLLAQAAVLGAAAAGLAALARRGAVPGVGEAGVGAARGDRSLEDGGDRSGTWLLGLVLASVVLLPFGVSQLGTSIFVPRYLIPALVPLVVLAARGLVAIPRPAPRWAAVGAVLLVSLPALAVSEGAPPAEDWRAMAADIGDDPRPVIVYRSFTSRPLRYYLERDGVEAPVLLAAAPDLPLRAAAASPGVPSAASVAAFAQNATALWVVVSHAKGAEGWLLDRLDAEMERGEERTYAGARLIGYTRAAPPPLLPPAEPAPEPGSGPSPGTAGPQAQP